MKLALMLILVPWMALAQALPPIPTNHFTLPTNLITGVVRSPQPLRLAFYASITTNLFSIVQSSTNLLDWRDYIKFYPDGLWHTNTVPTNSQCFYRIVFATPIVTSNIMLTNSVKPATIPK